MVYSLSGLYSLTTSKIDEVVTKISPGVYVLDREAGAFEVHYVGRSDDDINGRLKDYVGSKYKWFKFDYASSTKNAFEKECEIYHDYNPPDNKVHPRRPDGTNWQCPRCDIFK